jgi:hypothetical protein
LAEEADDVEVGVAVVVADVGDEDGEVGGEDGGGCRRGRWGRWLQVAEAKKVSEGLDRAAVVAELVGFVGVVFLEVVDGGDDGGDGVGGEGLEEAKGGEGESTASGVVVVFLAGEVGIGAHVGSGVGGDGEDAVEDVAAVGGEGCGDEEEIETIGSLSAFEQIVDEGRKQVGSARADAFEGLLFGVCLFARPAQELVAKMFDRRFVVTSYGGDDVGIYFRDLEQVGEEGGGLGAEMFERFGGDITEVFVLEGLVHEVGEGKKDGARVMQDGYEGVRAAAVGEGAGLKFVVIPRDIVGDFWALVVIVELAIEPCILAGVVGVRSLAVVFHGGKGGFDEFDSGEAGVIDF